MKEILNFLEYYNIKIDFSEKSIMTDYEHALRSAIKSNLHFIKITSCYFHYAKAIYKKCKYYHLFNKNNKKNTILIAFILKLFPYIPTGLRDEYLEKIRIYIKDLDKSYTKLLNYFEKNWINNKFFKFSEISDADIIKRTNNICESYHRHLNNIISHYHPKIGYLLIKLKEYITSTYNKYQESLYKKIDLDIEKINIYEEIYAFLNKYKNLVKENIDINNLKNNLSVFKDELELLFKKFLEVLYDEKDNFFSDFFENNDKENNDLVPKSNKDEENDNTDEEDDLIEKLDEMNINKNEFKNNVNYNNFEDEDLIYSKKKRKKVNSKGKTGKIKNKLNSLFYNN